MASASHNIECVGVVKHHPKLSAVWIGSAVELVKTGASLPRWQGESQPLLCDLYSLLLSCAFVTRLYTLIDPVLAFIKAFCLHGSSENLKMAALSKFDSIVMSKAKEALWDSECSSLLTKAGLCFQQHRGSGKEPKQLLT